MRNINFNVGSLVLACRMLDHQLHYDWNIGLNNPYEYAIIIKVVDSSLSYCVKFLDGSEEWVTEADLKLVVNGQNNDKV